MKTFLAELASAVLISGTAPVMAQSVEKPSIVVVHGAFVDGSGWAGVHGILSSEGYRVVVLQIPTTSLADDVAATKRAIAAARGPVVLVGHSYGGAVITEAGSDPRVAALVYVAAFAPDDEESVSSIVSSAPPGSPALPLLPPVDGMFTLDPGQFPKVFAADVAPDLARFMADAQQPLGAAALDGRITTTAWKTKPS